MQYVHIMLFLFHPVTMWTTMVIVKSMCLRMCTAHSLGQCSTGNAVKIVTKAYIE